MARMRRIRRRKDKFAEFGDVWRVNELAGVAETTYCTRIPSQATNVDPAEILQRDPLVRHQYLHIAAELTHWVEDVRSCQARKYRLKDLLQDMLTKGQVDGDCYSIAEAADFLLEAFLGHKVQKNSPIYWILERSSFGVRLMSKFPELAPGVAEAIVVHAERCGFWCCDEDLKHLIVQDGSMEDFVRTLIEYHSSIDNTLPEGRIFPGASIEFKNEVLNELSSPELSTRLRAQYINFITVFSTAVIKYAKVHRYWPQFLQKWLDSLIANGCGLEEFMAVLVEYHSTTNDGSDLNQIFSRASIEFKDNVTEVLAGPGLRHKVLAKFPELHNRQDSTSSSWICMECGFEVRATFLVCEFCGTRRGQGNVASAQGESINIFDHREFRTWTCDACTSECRATLLVCELCGTERDQENAESGQGISMSKQLLSSEGNVEPDVKASSGMGMLTVAVVDTSNARVHSDSVPPYALIAYLPLGLKVTCTEEVHKGLVQLVHPVPGWIRTDDLKPLHLRGSDTSETCPNTEMFTLMNETRQWLGSVPSHKCTVSARQLLDRLLEREQSAKLLSRFCRGSCRQVSGSFLAEETRRPWWPPDYECWVPHTFLAFADGSIADLTADQWNLDVPQLWWPADAHRYSLSCAKAEKASDIRQSFGKDAWQKLEAQDDITGVWRSKRNWNEIQEMNYKSAEYRPAWDLPAEQSEHGTFSLDASLRLQDVVLAAWVSAGHLPEWSRESLADLLKFARQHGVRDTVFCDHPAGYPIPGEGHEPYPKYIDMLITEIDKEPKRTGRPLVLFGQGWGSLHALALAARLGPRVLKVYILGRGPLVPGGLPSYIEDIANFFKQLGGNTSIRFLSMINEGNVFLENAVSATPEELEKMFEQSPWFTRMYNNAQTAFVNPIYPDMSRDLRILSCPICVFTALQDEAIQMTPEKNKPYILWTTGDYQAFSIDQGVYDCLRASKKKGEIIHFPLGDLLIQDMVKSLQKITWKHLHALTSSIYMPGR